jgi:hypothetical protein
MYSQVLAYSMPSRTQDLPNGANPAVRASRVKEVVANTAQSQRKSEMRIAKQPTQSDLAMINQTAMVSALEKVNLDQLLRGCEYVF